MHHLFVLTLKPFNKNNSSIRQKDTNNNIQQPFFLYCYIAYIWLYKHIHYNSARLLFKKTLQKKKKRQKIQKKPLQETLKKLEDINEIH